MSEKMNNQTLRASVKSLNDVTKQEFIVNSFDLGDSDKTQYGLVKKNKDGTMDLILDAKYTKRQIYYHIQGYLIFNQLSVSTLILDNISDSKEVTEDTIPPLIKEAIKKKSNLAKARAVKKEKKDKKL